MVNNAITRTPQEQLIRENEKLEKIISIYRELTGKQKAENDELNKENTELKAELKSKELEAETHLEAVKTCENWYFEHHINPLNEEIESNLELLEETKNSLEEHKAKVTELEKEKEADAEALQEISEKFEEQKKINEELQRQIYLDNKPLPKTPNKFKLFKEKTKVKFKQFQQVIKKAKIQGREFIAQIEVKTK